MGDPLSSIFLITGQEIDTIEECASNSHGFLKHVFIIRVKQVQSNLKQVQMCHDKRKRLWLRDEAIQDPSCPLTIGTFLLRHIMIQSHISSARTAETPNYFG